MVILTYLAEISPYFLYKYLIKVFPPINFYFGRAWIYLAVGLILLSPELNLDKIIDENISMNNNSNQFLTDYNLLYSYKDTNNTMNNSLHNITTLYDDLNYIELKVSKTYI